MWNVGKRILLLNSTYFSPADVIDETLYLYSRFNKGQSSLAKGDITRRLSICSVMSCHVMANILGLIEPEIVPFDPPTQKTLPWIELIGWPVAEIWSFEIWHITRGALGHHFGIKGGHRESLIVPFKIAMLVSYYRFSIVTIAHCTLTIRPQFAIECLRRLRQQMVGSILVKILGCSLWSRSVLLGSAESEHHRLTNCEIIFEEFQPRWSRYLNVTDRQTDRRTHRRTDE